MATMASDALGERVDEVLERVAAGEDVFITVDGREVARVTRVSNPSRWVPKGALFTGLGRVQADVGLQSVLSDLAPDTTDDLERF